MKISKLFLSLLLVLTLSFITLGCNDSTTQSTTELEEQSIEGEYLIDITDLGMPLVFYLKIDAESNFYLSSDRTYEVDKGHGIVGSSGDTYMLIYSDSTTEEPKNSTFKIEEGNLEFQTALPYGSSNLPASKVDDENPDITYYLVGNALVYEDYYGEYAGTHTVSAMGTEVVYDYYLKLEEGRQFEFVSSFEMSGEPQEYTESGYYDMEGTELSLDLGSETVIGNFDGNMDLTIPIKASSMASREERVLRVATTASCANTYYGYYASYTGETLDYEVDLVLVLDKFGGYVLTIDNSTSGETTETGAFTHVGQDLTFTPAVADDSYSATLANYVVNGEFLVDESTKDAVQLYCQTVQGTFTAEGEDEQENQYTAELILESDGTFTFTVKDADEELIVDEVGTFTITKTMLTQLNLISESENSYTMVISEVGLNVNVAVDEEKTIGFILQK